MEFIIVDQTGIVTFIKANNLHEACRFARDMGIKPFIVRQV